MIQTYTDHKHGALLRVSVCVCGLASLLVVVKEQQQDTNGTKSWRNSANLRCFARAFSVPACFFAFRLLRSLLLLVDAARPRVLHLRLGRYHRCVAPVRLIDCSFVRSIGISYGRLIEGGRQKNPRCFGFVSLGEICELMLDSGYEACGRRVSRRATPSDSGLLCDSAIPPTSGNE